MKTSNQYSTTKRAKRVRSNNLCNLVISPLKLASSKSSLSSAGGVTSVSLATSIGLVAMDVGSVADILLS